MALLKPHFRFKRITDVEVEFLKKNNINSITTFTEYEDMTGALSDEMVDALVMSELSYKYFAKNGFSDTFMTDIGASEVSFAVCMPNEAGALKEEVDKALLSLLEDKSLDKMAAKWFGSTLCLVR